MRITDDLILEFQCSDFDDLFGKHSGSTIDAADLANKLLRAEMEKWPMVKGYEAKDNMGWCMDQDPMPTVTHASRLVPPQKIKPKKKDTAEMILREWVTGETLPTHLFERAKNLLGEK